MATYDLGSAHGTIKIDFDKTGVDQGEQGLDRLGKKAGSTRGAFDSAAKGMGAAGLVIGAGLGVAIKSAADFESQLSEIKAVSGATTQQMQAVSDKALQLGKDTKFSASEAALAMTELSKAGIPIPDILNGAADAAVNLAAAGGVELPEAAELAANAMNQFSLTAQQLPQVADLIAGAANASAIDVHDFGESLKQVGAAANLAGIGFKDTAVAIALMGQAGIKGSDAGTSLKTFLLNLNPTTKKQTELMKELGIITKEGGNAFFDAAGKAKPLAQISEVLQNALKGMTQQQKLATLETLFGSDAIRASAILSKSGAEGFDKMATAMGKVKAADVAKTKMDNLKGSLEQFKGSLETAAITIGTIALPALKKIVDGVTTLVNKFTSLPTGMQKAVVIFATVVASLLLIGAGIIKVVFFIQKLVVALKLIGVAINATFLTNPVFLVIAAIVLLVVAIVLLWKNSETFRNIVTGVWNAVWGAITTAVSAIVNFVKTWWPLLLIILTGGLATLPILIIKFWDQIKGAFTAAISFIWNIAKSFFSTLLSIYLTGIKIITFPIRLWIGLVIGLFVGLYKLLRAAATAFWGAISGPVKAGLNLVMSIIRGALAVIKTVWNAVWNALSGPVKTAINAVSSFIRDKINAVKAIWKTVWGTIGPIIKAAFKTVVDAVTKGISTVVSKVQGIKNKVTGALSGAGKLLFNAGKNIVQGLWNGISSLGGWIAGKIRALINRVVPGPVRKLLGLGSPSKLFRGFGQDTMVGFELGLEDREKMLKRAAADIASAAIPSVSVSNVASQTASAPAASSTTFGSTSFPSADEFANALVRAMERNAMSVLTLTDTINKTSGRAAYQRRRTG